MTAVAEITKNQYKDLECYIGRKNLITKVTGKEYKIDTMNETTFQEGSFTLTPNELSSKSSASSFVLIKSTKDKSSEGWWLRTFGHNHFLREECYYLKGSYYFNITNSLISDLSSVKLTFQIHYNKYTSSSHVVGDWNYKSNDRTFTSMRNWGNRPSESRGENSDNATEYDSSTSGIIPHSSAKTSGLTPNFSTPTLSIPNQAFNLVFISKDRYFKTLDNKIFSTKTYYTKNGNNYVAVSSPTSSNLNNYYEKCEDGKFCYQYRVDYLLVVSTGHNDLNVNFWGTDSYWNEFFEVVNVDIKVKGLTVKSEELAKEYGKGTKTLELQTNEFMQSPITDTENMFDNVARQIVEAYKDNRILCKFKLLNNQILTINGVQRYLRAGDVIKIRDEHDKYIKSFENNGVEIGCDFEIIKADCKYEGFFYREIVAKEILNN